MSEDRIGFIGMGLMGMPMSTRLVAAGYDVCVWNRTPRHAAPAVDAGATLAPSVAGLVADSDIVMVCVSDTAAVEDVVFAQQGIAASGAEGKVLVDFSSIDPADTRQFAERLHAACGMTWVDAPVSGGVQGARDGTLAIMAGGSARDVDRLRPVLEHLSRQVTHMGDVGCGQTTKICNQMIVTSNVLTIAETVALAERAGVDARKIPEALGGGFADSRPLQLAGRRMADRDFDEVHWHVRTLLKDLLMAVKLGGDVDGQIPMTTLAAKLMDAHGSHGNLENDPSTLIQMYAMGDGDGI